MRLSTWTQTSFQWTEQSFSRSLYWKHSARQWRLARVKFFPTPQRRVRTLIFLDEKKKKKKNETHTCAWVDGRGCYRWQCQRQRVDTADRTTRCQCPGVCRVQETTNNSSLSAVPLQKRVAHVVAARRISRFCCIRLAKHTIFQLHSRSFTGYRRTYILQLNHVHETNVPRTLDRFVNFVCFMELGS